MFVVIVAIIVVVEKPSLVQNNTRYPNNMALLFLWWPSRGWNNVKKPQGQWLYPVISCGFTSWIRTKKNENSITSDDTWEFLDIFLHGFLPGCGRPWFSFGEEVFLLSSKKYMFKKKFREVIVSEVSKIRQIYLKDINVIEITLNTSDHVGSIQFIQYIITILSKMKPTLT